MKTVKKTAMLLVTLLLLAVCLTACQTTYAVTYKVTGMEELTVKTAKGERAVAPQIATAEGVTLDGWYIDQAYTDEYDFEQAVTKDVTLYARFKSTSYAVVYDLAHEAEGAQAPVQESVNYDGTFTVKDAPDRVGYEFKGWTDGEKVYLAGDTYTVTRAETVRLVATWEYKTVDVKFVYYGGEQTQKVLYGADVQPPAEAEHDFFCYELVDWEGGSLKKVTEQKTFTAIYDYVPTNPYMFDYEYDQKKNGWLLKRKSDFALPEELAFPDAWQGRAVVGLAEDFNFYDAIGTLKSDYIPDSFENGVNMGGISSLSTVIIGEGVKTLPDFAFCSCTDLSYVYIPASLEGFGGAAFADCPSVSFEFAENSKLIYTNNSIRSVDGTKLFYVDGSVSHYTVDRNVTWINVGLFGAFGYNKMPPESPLSSVVVDADLKLLPTSTFYLCSNLEKVTFNGVIEEIGGWQEYGETTEIGDMVFTSILAYSAFHISDSSNGAGKLKSLSFKSGLKRIGRSAFANIDTLESLSLPNTVEEIAMDALGRNIWGTDPLKKIEVTGDSDTDAGVIYGDSDNFALLVRGTGMGAAGSEGDTLMYVAKSNASVTVYRIPQGVTRIAPLALAYANNIKELVIPEGVTVLYGGSVANMASLESVTLPASLISLKAGISDSPEDGADEYLPFGESYMNLDIGILSGCYSLVNVNFEELINLEAIGRGAFSNSKVEEVFIGSEVRFIDYSAFKGVAARFAVDPDNEFYCSENGHLYDKAKSELIKGFYRQAKVEDIADTVEYIRTNSFYYAYGLSEVATEIILPENVFIVEYQAIYAYDIGKVSVGGGIEILGERSVYADNMDENWAPVANSFDVEFRGGSAPIVLSEAFCKDTLGTITVPDGAYETFYAEFSVLGFSDYIDATGQRTVTYNFVNGSGESPEAVTGTAVKNMPVPVYGQSGEMYFQGWFSKDGSTDGDWGEKASFPYFYKGEGNTATLYARWGDEKYEDGTFAFAYTIGLGSDEEPEDVNRFRIFNGDVFLVFDVEETAIYAVYATIEISEKHLLTFETYYLYGDGSIENTYGFLFMQGSTVLIRLVYTDLPEEGITEHLFMVNTWA